MITEEDLGFDFEVRTPEEVAEANEEESRRQEEMRRNQEVFSRVGPGTETETEGSGDGSWSPTPPIHSEADRYPWSSSLKLCRDITNIGIDNEFT